MRHQGQPFALLSVNTDEDRTVLQKSIKDGEITWRCWWDRGPQGPIRTNWNIARFPTVYVLDATATIRFKNRHGPSLDGAVKTLLNELEKRATDNGSAAVG